MFSTEIHSTEKKEKEKENPLSNLEDNAENESTGNERYSTMELSV